MPHIKQGRQTSTIYLNQTAYYAPLLYNKLYSGVARAKKQGLCQGHLASEQTTPTPRRCQVLCYVID